MYEYRMLQSTNPEHLEKQINELAQHGWELKTMSQSASSGVISSYYITIVMQKKLTGAEDGGKHGKK
jgi:hypothetical protein